ncbi:MAG TPA: DedA family protein [Anaerolineales bacterium]|nr:DedA family protein [Anaerolineales bacterium]HNB35916.1 DedA family protein [Anaerolineales bacterium]
MNLEALITHFGYPALILGLLLEGETVLILAAFMAHRGYLDLPFVIVIGGLVAFASDQFFFWLGRTQGSVFLAKRPAWQPHVEKAMSLLGRNTTLLFLGIRFMYGLRTVLPFVIGMSKLDPKKFTLLDLIGAFIWALTFGLAGHFIGHVMAIIFEDIKEHELLISVGIILAGIGIWLYRRHASKEEKGKKNE